MNSKATELTSKLHQNLYGTKDEVKNLSLMKKLNPANKNMGIGLTLVEGGNNFPMGLNTSVFSMMNDASKIKRKIVLPKDSNFNYTGLLIGPKGNNQKQLEEKTGCKIIVRGKGSQNPTGDAEDEEDLHVIVLGDGEAQVAKACAEIERIIFSEDDSGSRVKQEQMIQSQGLGG
jgi:far upstream element-binding protein